MTVNVQKRITSSKGGRVSSHGHAGRAASRIGRVSKPAGIAILDVLIHSLQRARAWAADPGESQNSSVVREGSEANDMKPVVNSVASQFYSPTTLPPLSAAAQKILAVIDAATPFVQQHIAGEQPPVGKKSKIFLTDAPRRGVSLTDKAQPSIFDK